MKKKNDVNLRIAFALFNNYFTLNVLYRNTRSYSMKPFNKMSVFMKDAFAISNMYRKYRA